MNTRVLLLLAFGGVACATPGLKPGPPPGVAVASITLTSKAFSGNGPIPIDYSCDGKDLSPPLTWSSPPEGTKSLAIEMEDPDASASSSFTHWLLWNVSADARSLAEAVDPATLGA